MVNFSGCEYHVPLDVDTMTNLTRKKFSSETMKKVNWVTRMYGDWRVYRSNDPSLVDIPCDLDNVQSVNKMDFVRLVCRFLTEVKKLNLQSFQVKPCIIL